MDVSLDTGTETIDVTDLNMVGAVKNTYCLLASSEPIW